MRDCPVCKGIGFLAFDVPVGHPDFERLVPCDHPCHNEERLARLAKVSGLESHNLGLRLSSFKVGSATTRAVMDAAQGFLDNPCSIFYLWGGPGNGKTLILKALVNEFNLRGYTAIYTSFFQLLWWMRQVFKEGNTEGFLDRYERLKRIRILAVDEVDKVNQTDFVQEFQFDFVNARYEAGLQEKCHTVFASNDAPDTLPSYLMSRITDSRCLVVENKAPDMRPKMNLKGKRK